MGSGTGEPGAAVEGLGGDDLRNPGYPVFTGDEVIGLGMGEALDPMTTRAPQPPYP
jgi:hypothetical protein